MNFRAAGQPALNNNNADLSLQRLYLHLPYSDYYIWMSKLLIIKKRITSPCVVDKGRHKEAWFKKTRNISFFILTLQCR